MLVTGEQDVEVQFPADAVALVLVGVRQEQPGVQVTFKAAVVDAHSHVRPLLPQLCQSLPGGGQRVGDGDAF